MKPPLPGRMRQINRGLAIAAAVVLLVALALLGGLRRQTVANFNRDIREMAESFVPDTLLHGPGGDSIVRFERANELVDRGLNSPYISEAVVSLTLPGRPETFIHPFTFAIDHAADLGPTLAGYEVFPLGPPGAPFGKLYLKLDRTIVGRINQAIGATALAILLMLATLLARVWSQETSLTKTVIELNDRRRELIRIERLALAGEISAGLLHDLRKPVLNIRHSLEEMQEALGDFAPAAASLEELQRNTQLFFEILGDSRIERFVRSDRVGDEFVDIGPALDYSLALVRYEQRGVEVARSQEGDPPPIYAQPFKLIQLFSNLILNSYQAMEGRGQLRIEVAAVKGGVLIRLSDTGPGISPEVQARVFDPFFTTKPEGEGTGLGLSICRLIVEDLNGWIRVESRTGGPTAFVVWLPGEAVPTETPEA